MCTALLKKVFSCAPSLEEAQIKALTKGETSKFYGIPTYKDIKAVALITLGPTSETRMKILFLPPEPTGKSEVHPLEPANQLPKSDKGILSNSQYQTSGTRTYLPVDPFAIKFFIKPTRDGIRIQI